MGRQVVKDERLRTLGYIEQQPDGRLKAVNAKEETIGWYDPLRNLTLDADQRPLVLGDGLAELLLGGEPTRGAA